MNEPTEQDLERWAKWDDLRARQAEATTELEMTELALEQEALEVESLKQMLHVEMDQEPIWFWLSFRDVDTDTNLGVAIVEGGGVVEATLNAKLAKCNPGGEVLAYPLDSEKLPPEEYRYCLLSEEDLMEAGLTEARASS